MKNTILIKFTNGDWFEVSVKAIAEKRAEYYSEDPDTGVFDPNSSEYHSEVQYVVENPLEALDWLQNNMDWEDIEELGEFVNAEPFDHAEGFFDAGFEVLKK